MFNKDRVDSQQLPRMSLTAKSVSVADASKYLTLGKAAKKKSQSDCLM